MEVINQDRVQGRDNCPPKVELSTTCEVMKSVPHPLSSSLSRTGHVPGLVLCGAAHKPASVWYMGGLHGRAWAVGTGRNGCVRNGQFPFHMTCRS